MDNVLQDKQIDYIRAAHDLFDRAVLSRNHLQGLNVWIGASRHDDVSIQLKGLYEYALKRLGVNIVDGDFSAILAGRIKCDILLMFTLTPGISARAIELVIASKYDHTLAGAKDGLYVYMPDEYRGGYISRKLAEHLIAGKLCHKERILFEQLDWGLFRRCVTHLADIVNDKNKELRITFKPSILIVTALPLEFDMMVNLLESERYDPAFGDERKQYPHGVIGQQDVVVAMSGVGNNFSSAIATRVLDRYPSIHYIFMTGIAGGIPYIENGDEHVRLGDIVICNGKGIVQHDMGKNVIRAKNYISRLVSRIRGVSVPSEFEYNFSPRPPDATLLRNVEIHVQRSGTGRYIYWEYLDSLLGRRNLGRPESADLCDTPWVEGSSLRQPPVPSGYDESRPRIHFSVIASGNSVIKDVRVRDKLKSDFRAKAVEMEVSGVSDAAWLKGKNYFMVRGICDYANPDKNKKWQPYAAAAAAAFTREIIEVTFGND